MGSFVAQNSCWILAHLYYMNRCILSFFHRSCLSLWVAREELYGALGRPGSWVRATCSECVPSPAVCQNNRLSTGFPGWAEFPPAPGHPNTPATGTNPAVPPFESSTHRYRIDIAFSICTFVHHIHAGTSWPDTNPAGYLILRICHLEDFHPLLFQFILAECGGIFLRRELCQLFKNLVSVRVVAVNTGLVVQFGKNTTEQLRQDQFAHKSRASSHSSQTPW